MVQPEQAGPGSMKAAVRPAIITRPPFVCSRWFTLSCLLNFSSREIGPYFCLGQRGERMPVWACAAVSHPSLPSRAGELREWPPRPLASQLRGTALSAELLEVPHTHSIFHLHGPCSGCHCFSAEPLIEISFLLRVLFTLPSVCISQCKVSSLCV